MATSKKVTKAEMAEISALIIEQTWQSDVEGAAVNFCTSEYLTGQYSIQLVRAFPKELDFEGYEVRRVAFGKAYKAEKGNITQDAVDAAFNRAMKKAFADIGGYTKPKAATNDAERVGKARSEKQEKAAEIAATYAPEEIAEKVRHLSNVVVCAKGKEKTEARTERAQMEAALALIQKTATESEKSEEKQLNEVWKSLSLNQKRLALSVI